jgi:hypothetical protein
MFILWKPNNTRPAMNPQLSTRKKKLILDNTNMFFERGCDDGRGSRIMGYALAITDKPGACRKRGECTLS